MDCRFKVTNCIFGLALALHLQCVLSFQTSFLIGKKSSITPLNTEILRMFKGQLSSRKSFSQDVLQVKQTDMIAVQSKLRSLEREVPQALELEQLRLNQPETSMNYFVEEKSSVIMDAARLSRVSNLINSLNTELFYMDDLRELMDAADEDGIDMLKQEVEKLTAQHRSNLAWIRFLRSTERKTRGL
uniref:Uncharacterized protein n=1 Tax=Hanusia phi TaxID=3032 RepID=A0A7S0E970_9CRYP|mmetsp:Transcript_19477/g.44566  ORF Transcript_19477/g.44566 Transcript_19477/m.44566 type:complete len:187 (+) Transcript_19477:210-770(+)